MGRTASQSTASQRTAGPVERDLVQAAIVALLCERESHGYELLSRLDELGLCPGTVALYRTLRSMEGDGTVCSSWDCPAQGPARRTYTPTYGGRGRPGDAQAEN
ncbi:MAG: helix-turn-helix transcriptional regulator [Actinobacteria bacterium]|nr:helix-turn-helix transcriptional regulator [Actinomycetota bacterium]